jgi:hypothetical protein
VRFAVADIAADDDDDDEPRGCVLGGGRDALADFEFVDFAVLTSTALSTMSCTSWFSITRSRVCAISFSETSLGRSGMTW